MTIERLQEFRQQAYEALTKAKDATFELMDAVLVTPKVSSYVELSLSPVFRRRWSSIYEALEDTRPQPEQLMKQYIQQMPSQGQIILAGDHTHWSRPDAVTLKERTYEHASAGIGGGKPIAVGQGYSTIAWIPESTGSWALPLRHERISSCDNPLSLGTHQLKAIASALTVRPLCLWDSEYGNASFLKQTADIEADQLIRLRPNRCLWTEPPPYGGRGRPRKHGDKFRLNDPSTWSEPTQQQDVTDERWGLIQLQCWQGLHFYQAPEQSQRWSHLMPLMTWQLWLARKVVSDRPLPWQKSQPPSSLSPGRVAQSLSSILAVIGTPARSPKLRGNSPGWVTGTPRTPRIRYPTVKKGRGRFLSQSQSPPSSS